MHQIPAGAGTQRGTRRGKDVACAAFKQIVSGCRLCARVSLSLLPKNNVCNFKKENVLGLCGKGP